MHLTKELFQIYKGNSLKCYISNIRRYYLYKISIQLSNLRYNINR